MFQLYSKYIIIPGWKGSGPDHWQTYWQKKLFPSSRVSVSSWDEPNPEDWVKAINSAVEAANNEVVIVAHSLGCIAFTKWVSNAHPHLVAKIQGALLVAPADVERPDCPSTIKTFAPIPSQRLPFKSIIIGSENDPAASKKRIQTFSKNWGAQCEIIGKVGHINTLSGHTEWINGFYWLSQLQQHVAA